MFYKSMYDFIVYIYMYDNIMFKNCCNIFMETKLKFDAIMYMYIVGNIPGKYACSF